MNDISIQKGSLVIVIDRNSNPPCFCWGIVRKQFPSGDNFDVQIGDSEEQKIIAKGELLIPVIQTEGGFKNPTVAVEYYRDKILLHVALIAFTSRDFQELKRFKARTERTLRNRLRKGWQRLFHRV